MQAFVTLNQVLIMGGNLCQIDSLSTEENNS